MRWTVYRSAFVISFFTCFLMLVWAGFSVISGTTAGVPRQLAERNKVLSPRAEATIHYDKEHPASMEPMLTWSKVDGAVCYEIELLSRRPKNPTLPETDENCFFSTKKIFINGFNAAIPDTLRKHSFYWRVRGLDLQGRPISEFSDVERVFLDRNQDIQLKPLPVSVFNQGTGTTLLNPVYDWVPVHGATQYEVEILDAEPENPNDIEPSIHRIDSAIVTGSEWYDTHSRVSPMPFYWRVRGLDEEGSPVGVYSDAGTFRTSTEDHFAVATYGDSITHGGGSLSYTPTDWEYSYQHYLNFQSVNLGQSGDTSTMTADRFERDVLPFQPKYLIILMGSNSMRIGTDPETIIRDMETVRTKALAHHIRPVFLTMPPINPANLKITFNEDTALNWQGHRETINEYIRKQIYIDVAAEMTDDYGNLPTALALDGLHPDPAGKKIMATSINAEWSHILQIPDDVWFGHEN